MTVRTESSWVLAIDFGTSYTTAAVTDGRRDPVILSLDEAHRMPSTVFLDEDEDGTIRVGRSAQRLLEVDPTRAVRAPKIPLAGLGEKVTLGTEPGKSIPVVVLVGHLMARAWKEALRFTGGEEPTRVVLTHPASWSKPRTDRLKAAARSGGVTAPIELVQEPVAAMIYYSSFRPAHGPVAVYDLGGGTFDTAVLIPDGAGMTLVGQPMGDPEVGGNLFDEMLLEWLLDQLPDDDPVRAAIAPVSEADRRLRARIERRVTEARESLSEGESVPIILDDRIKPMILHRHHLEEVISGPVRTTIRTVRKMLDEAGVPASSLEAVFLSGGAARTPLVSSLLKEEFGLPIVTRGDPKVAVCLGAARAASLNAAGRDAQTNGDLGDQVVDDQPPGKEEGDERVRPGNGSGGPEPAAPPAPDPSVPLLSDEEIVAQAAVASVPPMWIGARVARRSYEIIATNRRVLLCRSATSNRARAVEQEWSRDEVAAMRTRRGRSFDTIGLEVPGGGPLTFRVGRDNRAAMQSLLSDLRQSPREPKGGGRKAALGVAVVALTGGLAAAGVQLSAPSDDEPTYYPPNTTSPPVTTNSGLTTADQSLLAKVPISVRASCTRDPEPYSKTVAALKCSSGGAIVYYEQYSNQQDMRANLNPQGVSESAGGCDPANNPSFTAASTWTSTGTKGGVVCRYDDKGQALLTWTQDELNLLGLVIIAGSDKAGMARSAYQAWGAALIR